MLPSPLWVRLWVCVFRLNEASAAVWYDGEVLDSVGQEVSILKCFPLVHPCKKNAFGNCAFDLYIILGHIIRIIINYTLLFNLGSHIVIRRLWKQDRSWLI